MVPHYNMSWARQECFRDPVPVSRDYFLVSHAPADRFGLYVIDRYGNRELLYLDPAMGSMCPTLLRAVPRPPVLPQTGPEVARDEETGQFTVADVYQGLGGAVPRGKVKYLRVCQEVRSELEAIAQRRVSQRSSALHRLLRHADPQGDRSGGLAHLRRQGLPGPGAGRGRRIGQLLRPGGQSALLPGSSTRTTPKSSGCEAWCNCKPASSGAASAATRTGSRPRRCTPPNCAGRARQPSRLQPPPWGSGPFSYEKVVQPVWDAQCVRCHDANDKHQINLTGTLDADDAGLLPHADLRRLGPLLRLPLGLRHAKAAPLTFGTLKSRFGRFSSAGITT